MPPSLRDLLPGYSTNTSLNDLLPGYAPAPAQPTLRSPDTSTLDDRTEAADMTEVGKAWKSTRLGTDAAYLRGEEYSARRAGRKAEADALRDELENVQARAATYRQAEPSFMDVYDKPSLRRVADWVGGTIGSTGASMVDSIASGGAAKLAANAIGIIPHPLTQLIGRGANAISAAAAFTPNLLQARGNTLGSMEDDKTIMGTTDVAQRDNAAWVSGAAQGAVDTILPKMFIDRALGKGFRKGMASMSTPTAVGAEMLGSGTEEVVQDRMEKATLSYLNPNRDTSNDMREAIDNFAAGTAGVAPISIASHAMDKGYRRLGTEGDGKNGDQIPLDDTAPPPKILEKLNGGSRFTKKAEAMDYVDVLSGQPPGGEVTMEWMEQAGETRKQALAKELDGIGTDRAKELRAQVDTIDPSSFDDPAFEEATKYVLTKLHLTDKEVGQMKNNAERVRSSDLGGSVGGAGTANIDSVMLPSGERQKLSEDKLKLAETQITEHKQTLSLLADKFKVAAAANGSRTDVNELAQEVMAVTTIEKPTEPEMRRAARLGERLAQVMGEDAPTILAGLGRRANSPLLEVLQTTATAYAAMGDRASLEQQQLNRTEAAIGFTSLIPATVERRLLNDHGINLDDEKDQNDLLDLVEDFFDGRSSATIMQLNKLLTAPVVKAMGEYLGQKIQPRLREDVGAEYESGTTQATDSNKQMIEAENEESSAFEVAGEERSLDKVAPESMVFHHGDKGSTSRDIKDAWKESEGGNLPQLLREGNEGPEALLTRVKALAGRAASALGIQRDRYVIGNPTSKNPYEAAGATSARKMMDDANMQDSQRADLMLRYMAKENKGLDLDELTNTVGVTSYLDSLHRKLSSVVGDTTSLSPSGAKLSVAQAAEIQNLKINFDKLEGLAATPEDAARVKELFKADPQTKYVGLAQIVARAKKAADQYLTTMPGYSEFVEKAQAEQDRTPEFREYVNDYFDNRYAVVAEQPTNRDHGQMNLNEFKTIAKKGQANHGSAFASTGSSAKGDLARARAGMNLIHFESKHATNEDGTVMLPAYLLVKWVRDMRNAHEKDVEVDGAGTTSNSPTRQTESYKRDLLEGIAAVTMGGLTDGLPWIVNEKGVREDFGAAETAGKARGVAHMNEEGYVGGSTEQERYAPRKVANVIERADGPDEIDGWKQAGLGSLPPSLDLDGTTAEKAAKNSAFSAEQRRDEKATEQRQNPLAAAAKRHIAENKKDVELSQDERDVQSTESVDESLAVAEGSETRQEEQKNQAIMSSIMRSAADRAPKSMTPGQAFNTAGKMAQALWKAYSKNRETGLARIMSYIFAADLPTYSEDQNERVGGKHYVAPLAAMLTPRNLANARKQDVALLTLLRGRVANEMLQMMNPPMGVQKSITWQQEKTLVGFLSGKADTVAMKQLDRVTPPSADVLAARKEGTQWTETKVPFKGEKAFLEELAKPYRDFVAKNGVGKRAEPAVNRGNPTVTGPVQGAEQKQSLAEQSIHAETMAIAYHQPVSEIDTRTAAPALGTKTEGRSQDETVTVKGQAKTRGDKAFSGGLMEAMRNVLKIVTAPLGTIPSTGQKAGDLTAKLKKLFKGADIGKAVKVYQTVEEALKDAGIKVSDAMLSQKSKRAGLEGTGMLEHWFQYVEGRIPVALMEKILKGGKNGDAINLLSDYVKEDVEAIEDRLEGEFSRARPGGYLDPYKKYVSASMQRYKDAYEAGAMLDQQIQQAVRRSWKDGDAAVEGLAHSMWQKRSTGVRGLTNMLGSTTNGRAAFSTFEQHFILASVEKALAKNIEYIPEFNLRTALKTIDRLNTTKAGSASFDTEYARTALEGDVSQKFEDEVGGTWRKYGQVSQSSRYEDDGIGGSVVVQKSQDTIDALTARSLSTWCTSKNMSGHYLSQGDFWVYSDAKGKTKYALQLSGDKASQLQNVNNDGRITSVEAARFDWLAKSGHLSKEQSDNVVAKLEDKHTVVGVEDTDIQKRIRERRLEKLQSLYKWDDPETNTIQYAAEVLNLVGVSATINGDKITVHGDLDMGDQKLGDIFSTHGQYAQDPSDSRHASPFAKLALGNIERIEGTLTLATQENNYGSELYWGSVFKNLRSATNLLAAPTGRFTAAPLTELEGAELADVKHQLPKYEFTEEQTQKITAHEIALGAALAKNKEFNKSTPVRFGSLVAISGRDADQISEGLLVHDANGTPHIKIENLPDALFPKYIVKNPGEIGPDGEFYTATAYMQKLRVEVSAELADTIRARGFDNVRYTEDGIPTVSFWDLDDMEGGSDIAMARFFFDHGRAMHSALSEVPGNYERIAVMPPEAADGDDIDLDAIPWEDHHDRPRVGPRGGRLVAPPRPRPPAPRPLARGEAALRDRARALGVPAPRPRGMGPWQAEWDAAVEAGDLDQMQVIEDAMQAQIDADWEAQAARNQAINDWFDEIPFSRRADGTIQGFYDPKGKMSYLIADGIANGSEMAVVLHEIGTHMGMEKMLGKAKYQQLVGQIKKWENGLGLNKQIAQAARKRVEASGAKGELADHELLAYFVEEAVKAGIDPTVLGTSALAKWLNQVWDAVKAALGAMGWDTSKLEARDVVALAYGAARLQMGEKVGEGSKVEAAATLETLPGAPKSPPFAQAKENAKMAGADLVLAPSSAEEGYAGNLARWAEAAGRLAGTKAAGLAGKVVYVSVPGATRGWDGIDTLITRAKLALEAGATLRTDNYDNATSKHNKTGEGVLRAALIEAGYTEKSGPMMSEWTKSKTGVKNNSETLDRPSAAQQAKSVANPPKNIEVTTAIAHFKKTLSDKVRVIFAESFPDMVGSADYNTVENLARISTANPLTIMKLAYHESMHGFFSTVLNAKGHEAAKAMMFKAMSEPALYGRLKDIFKDEPGVLADMEKDPEERVAYAYQLWAMGMLNIARKPEGFFQRVQALMRRVFGEVSDSDKALAMFTAFHNGDLKEPSAAGKAIMRIMQTGEWRKAFLKRFDKQVQATYAEVMANHLVGRESESTTAQMINNMFYSNPAYAEDLAHDGVINRTQLVRKQFINRLRLAVRPLSGVNADRDLKALGEALNAHTTPELAHVAKAKVAIQAMLKKYHDYAREAGIDIGERYGTQGDPDYFTRVLDMEKLVDNKAKFVEMLMSKYSHVLKPAIPLLQKKLGTESRPTEQDVAESIYQMYLDNNGVDDSKISAMREDGVLNPYFAAQNERKLYWIADEDIAPFLNTDVIGTLTQYLSQGVRAAEYTRAFGKGGEKLKDWMAMEGDVKSVDKDGNVIKYEQDGEVGTELKAAAKEAGLKGKKAEEWVNRRIDDLRRSHGAYEGSLGKDISAEFRNLSSGVMMYQIIRLLPLMIFSSMLDPNGIRVAGGTADDMWDAYKRGFVGLWNNYKDMFLGNPFGSRDPDALEMAAMEAGVIDGSMELEEMGDVHSSEYSSGMTRKVGHAFFKAVGITQWDRDMRVMATAAARKSIVSSFNNEVPQHSARWLKEIGLKREQVFVNAAGELIVSARELAVKNSITREEAAKLLGPTHLAVNRWVNRAIVSPNAGLRPTRASDPHFAAVFQFKSFTYAFQETTMRYALHEAEQGNYDHGAQLLRGIPIMLASDLTKALVTGGGSLPGYMANWTIADWLGHAFNRAGLGGTGTFATDILRGDIVGTLAGPTAGQISGTIQDVMSGDIGKAVIDAIPGVRQAKHAFM